MAALLLCACGERDAAPAPPAASSASVPTPAVAKAPPAGTSPAAQASAPPAALALPARFTALGTEPFWAAKVAGARLTYSTPEDQTGQAIAVTRTTQADRIDVVGALAGQRLMLTVTTGPCNDGMSDVVYPFAVLRRLGNDEQRGCARPD